MGDRALCVERTLTREGTLKAPGVRMIQLKLLICEGAEPVPRE